MKVHQLIEILQKFDPEKDVVFCNYNDDSDEQFNLKRPDGVEIIKTDSGLEIVCIYENESF